MNHSEVLQREIENLRERLSRLSQASLRIAGGLDLDGVYRLTEHQPAAGYRRLGHLRRAT